MIKDQLMEANIEENEALSLGIIMILILLVITFDLGMWIGTKI